MSTLYLRARASADGSAVEAGKGAPLHIIAATAGRKSDGIDLADLPWDMRRGKPADGGRMRFPLLWAHDLSGTRLPLGYAYVGVGADGTTLDDTYIVFDPDDADAVAVERKYRSEHGGLDSFSITWDVVDGDGLSVRATGKKAAANQLLEVSAVPVPIDADATVRTQRAALADLGRRLLDLADGDDDDGAGDAAGDGNGTGGRMLPGSYEVLGSELRDAALESDLFPGARSVWPMSTFHDRVVFGVLFKSDETYSERYFDTPYTRDGNKVAFGEPAEVEITWTVSERPVKGRGDNGTTGAARAAGESGQDETAAAMVALYTPALCDPDDDARRREYRALAARYQRLGWTAPEFVPLDELRALDDDNWRAIWLNGEVTMTGERVAKVLAARNRERLQTARDAIDAVLQDDAAAAASEERGAERGILSALGARDMAEAIAKLQEVIEYLEAEADGEDGADDAAGDGEGAPGEAGEADGEADADMRALFAELDRILSA